MLGPWRMSNIPKRQEGWAVRGQEAELKYQLPRVKVVKQVENPLAGGRVKPLLLLEKKLIILAKPSPAGVLASAESDAEAYRICYKMVSDVIDAYERHHASPCKRPWSGFSVDVQYSEK